MFAGAQGATALRAEGCGIALGHTFGVRVLKMDRPDGRKVLKFDGLSGRGLWIALRAILIKSALRIYLSVSYDMISTTIMSHLRWLPPFGALRHHLPPAERWDYKDMKGSLLIVDSTVLLYRWRQPPKKGGMHFLARRAVVKVFYKRAPSII